MKSLVGELAHSFNNSLAPLAGYAALLGEELRTGTAGAQYVGKLQASLGKAEDFVEAVLAATHPERHFLPRPIDLASLLQQSIDRWMKSLNPSIPIAVETRFVPCTLCLDETQWMHAIRHLLHNAQLALSARGVLRVVLDEVLLTPTVAAELDLHSLAVYRVTVQDNGCGMAPEVLERACEPLYTTRPESRLAGLGLTLVHSVVQLHGGQMEIESAEEAGTTVTVWLPKEPA